MKRILLFLLAAATLTACELHDQVQASVKRKAIVHLVYHYDNGREQTLDEIRSMRLLIYDRRGDLFRDAPMTGEQFLCDTGAMQTFLPNGDYSFISWANVGEKTSLAPKRLPDGMLSISTAGADPLYFGRCDTPVVKGDSLLFDIHLFKSVFKVNVRVMGLDAAPMPEEHYFGIENRSALTLDNRPAGELRRYRPQLQYADGVLSGSFYMPFYTEGDDLTLGVYCDNPASQYTTLCESSVSDFENFTQGSVGKDFEINVEIRIDRAGVSIVISDWLGQVIQNENLGS